ncbi:MAG: IMP dehydrogenase [Candidatus Eisenbacteria bacterium]|uniref:Inosine-5'-monophosphate dehydrogenase n=1 Tax=Eiseniibacteriota bacterium TaxID=2212470 RepID=A0A538U1I3_UNCEI|nr:MAG: IMP dehydrogenase [Candidatus Eisenbacteria bacterium]
MWAEKIQAAARAATAPVPWGEKIGPEALTFDDVLLVPRLSEVHPRDVDTRTRFSRHIELNVPIVSAAMDTVTESELAIAIAREGGIGVLHKNLSIPDQAAQVDRVKRSESGMIVDPFTLPPDASLRQAHDLMTRYHISGVPITEDGRLVGILTNRDLRFEDDLDRRVAEVMTRERLVTAPVGTTLEQARAILARHRIEKLPVVDAEGRLKGLITVKDIEKRIRHPQASKDALGRLRVAAAVGASGDAYERGAELVKAGVDALVVDSAHAHSRGVLETAERMRAAFPDVDLIVGNVGTAEGAKAVAAAGADAVKVGMGPGAICTTRVVTGAGMAQITAVLEAARALEDQDVPIIADGGIKYTGDVVKALAAGAHTVMIGSLFAGTEESPGEVVLLEGRSYKVYRGMGSLSAMAAGRGSRERYFQEGEDELSKLVPEGIEGRVPFKGPLAMVMFQMVGGLRAGMGYCGVRDVEELRTHTRFVRISGAGLRESHPHDVRITQEAPNYEMPGR